MKQVLVVKGRGPGIEDLILNAPPLGNGGEVTFTLIPVNEGPIPDTFGVQGQIIGIFKFETTKGKVTLFIHIPVSQGHHEYLMVDYDYKLREECGAIYSVSEFYELAIMKAMFCKT